MLLSGLNTVSEPVPTELCIGPNFRAPMTHSSNDWVGAGGRITHLRRLKEPPSWSEAPSWPSVNILWRSHWPVVGDARWQEEKVGFYEGNGKQPQKNASRLLMQSPQQAVLLNFPQREEGIGLFKPFCSKMGFINFKFAGVDAKTQNLKQDILIEYFFTVSKTLLLKKKSIASL